jgi:SAM-dependent methyltransferase
LNIPILKEKSVIGAGYRQNRTCPGCESIDRERLVYVYLARKTSVFRNNLKLLHVAPEKKLQEVLAAAPNIEYYSVDISSQLAKDRMDITDLKYHSNCFDVVICNHVLEHVQDDRKAMSEIHRVLKPGGWAVLQVPISLLLDHTVEDARVVMPEEREKLFGQADHVRIYGRDYKARLESTGFRVERYSFTEEFGKTECHKYGLIAEEHVYVCRKPLA